ncbi:nitroreductase family protein [Psychrobacillus sp. NPDC093180]|uniref:nitroreductase family protein n=1 Tax=Psychrobacillus sp. NPDC093180 TaxID=3364489 RepID=UPI00380586B5
MTKSFYSAVQSRRSIYGINDEKIISDERIQDIISLVVKHTPTAFNSQTGRVVVLLGDQHIKFWKLAFESVKEGLAEEKIASTQSRFEGFASGYGTVLFFEDYSVVESFQKKFASVGDHFPVWSHQASGMLQYLVWTALEQEGFGASLQHIYPTLSKEVKESWGIQEKWELIAELPFGNPISSPKEKLIEPVEHRVVIIK